MARDGAQALAWTRKAAEQGNVRAQSRLAAMYEQGLGMLHRDNAQAYVWFGIAAAQGSEQAASDRRRVAARLGAKDVAAAEARITAWLRDHPDSGG